MGNTGTCSLHGKRYLAVLVIMRFKGEKDNGSAKL
jgi:hypothetical protein